MIIYLDLIILIDGFITYIYLTLIDKILNIKSNNKRKIFASMFSLILILSYLFDYYLYLIVKVIGGTLIIILSSKIGCLKEFIVKVSLFYLLNFSFIGVLSSFKIDEIFLSFLSFFIVVLLAVLESNKKEIININLNTYDVVVLLINDSIKLKGFMDNGNSSSFKGKPIIYLDKKYLNNSFKYSGNAIVSTVNGVELHRVYECSGVIVNKIERDAFIVFIELFDKECLLNVLMI